MNRRYPGVMDFVQRISQQLADSGEYDSDGEKYVILGEFYPVTLDQQTRSEIQSNSTGFLNGFFSKNVERNSAFTSDVRTRLHFTYRTRFTPIPRAADGPSPLSFHFLFRENPLNTIENAISNPDCFNTDVGWGCMIRTGQSLLGNALQIARLGREFRIDDETSQEEAKIIDWFVDTPAAHFSIHNFVAKGMELSNKKPGEWFGPAAASRSIQSLVREFPECGIDECLISVSSGDVYEDEVKDIFEKNKNSKILLLLGVKLGIHAVNEYYWDEIKQLLQSKFSVGIAGGRPSSSLYFIGFQGNELLYFDPHTAQPSLQQSLQSTYSETCHTANFGKLMVSDLDPSMLIGILLRGEDQWLQWKKEVVCSKIINVLEKRPCDLDMAYEDDMESVDSPLSDVQNDESTIVEGEYVDIKVTPQNNRNSVAERDDGYQDIQCKKQQIVVMGDRSCSYNSADIEVEKILVEQETIGVADTNENIL